MNVNTPETALSAIANLMEELKRQGRHATFVTLTPGEVEKVANRFGPPPVGFAVGIRVPSRDKSAQPGDTIVAMMVVPTNLEGD
jgi:hypothetical protein